MVHLINKDTLVKEIEKRKKEAESNCGGYKSYDEHRCDACIVGFYEEFLEILNTIEVKEVDLETDVERGYVKCHIDIFDKKFPIMPTLKGQYLHDYKNFLNTCQQIFGLKWWGMHPTQARLFEKLSLLWATWGAQHLKGLFEMSPEERQKMDDIKVE